MTVVVICFVVLVVLVMIGLPVAVSLGLAGLVGLYVIGLPLSTAPQMIIQGLNSFTLTAIPLFILTGAILHHSGASERLVRLVRMLTGWLPGGLAFSAVGAALVFSGMSGSVNADAAAIGGTVIPPMTKAGYRPAWAAAIVAASAGTGVLVPPSIMIIVLGTIANISVQTLFIASVLPVALVVGAKLVVIFIWGLRNDYDRANRPHVTAKELGKAFVDAVPCLFAPVIILGGIFSGVFTATESGAAAAFYATILALIYRTMAPRTWLTVIERATTTSGTVLLLVGVAQLLAYIFAYQQADVALAEWAHGLTDHYLLFVTVTMVLFWIVGAVLDGLPALLVLIPLFTPVALEAGMTDVHFAIFSLAVFSISLVTPPIGTACFIVCGIADIKMTQLVRPMLPFIVVLVVAMLLLAYIPFLSEWLPGLVS